ncbi:MAG: hypothetical protein ACRDFB_09400 [Rhabdochlamydiaceae bacterium]
MNIEENSASFLNYEKACITYLKITAMKKKHVAGISGSVALASSLIAYFSLNTQFTLIMPDNAEIYNATLSPDNFSRLQQNVGVFTVYQSHSTTQSVTIDYCKIAKFIHENEDGYNYTHVGNTTIYNATIPPAWCDPELNPIPVPEFSSVDMILACSIGILVVFYSRTIK